MGTVIPGNYRLSAVRSDSCLSGQAVSGLLPPSGVSPGWVVGRQGEYREMFSALSLIVRQVSTMGFSPIYISSLVGNVPLKSGTDRDHESTILPTS